MNKTGAYTNWSGETYVLTDHVSYPEGLAAAGNDAQFAGTFNGDYHKISGLKDALFRNLGTATIENVIMNQIEIDKPDGYEEVGAAGVVALRSYGHVKIKRIFLSQAKVSGGHDVGYMIGKMAGTLAGCSLVVSESGAVGGSLDSKQKDRVIGGVIGFTGGRPLTMDNILSLKVNLNAKGGNNTMAGVGIPYGGTVNISNILVASQFSGNYFGSQSGGIMGAWAGVEPSGAFQALYFDSILAPNSVLAGKSYKGTPVQTAGLIGDQLKSSFDANLSGNSETVWTYADGFYPRLKWMETDPVCALFAATRGAFTSTDGKTGRDDMFAGTIHGPIEVPQELQKEGYSYSTDGCLTVDSSGQVVPTGTGAGNVTISYQDELMSAENTYDFNVDMEPVDVMRKFDTVEISNGGSAKIGTELQARAVFDSSDTNPPEASEITYQ